MSDADDTDWIHEIAKPAKDSKATPKKPPLATIAPGDVVKLKSGGPAMTVIELVESDGESARCMWMTEIDRRLTAIPLFVLVKVEANDG